MEIPEALQKYRNMTDKEQQEKAREIVEVIERLAAAGLLGNNIAKER